MFGKKMNDDCNALCAASPNVQRRHRPRVRAQAGRWRKFSSAAVSGDRDFRNDTCAELASQLNSVNPVQEFSWRRLALTGTTLVDANPRAVPILFQPRKDRSGKTFILSSLIALAGAPAAAISVNTIIELNSSSGLDPDCLVIGGGAGTRNCMISEDVDSNTAVYRSTADFTTRAAPGDIGVSGSLNVEVSSFGFAGGFRSDLNFSQYSFDTLTFNIAAGTLLLPIDLAGTQSVSPIPQGQTGGGGRSFALASFNVVSNSGGLDQVEQVYQRTDQVITGFPPVTSQSGSLGTTVLSLAFAGGELDLTTGLTGTLTCEGRFDEGQSCNARVDYLNSARYLAATLLDGNGDVVQTPMISSTSGFDYLVGLPPHAVVPLPAAGWALLGGLAGLGAVGRRRNLRAG